MNCGEGETRKRTASRSLSRSRDVAENGNAKRARIEDGRARNGGTSTTASGTETSASHQWISDGCRLGPPATYNKYLSVMATVRTLGMKEKRELFKLMREGAAGKRGRVTEHTFIPRLGVTMGEFALFYVLNDDPRAPS
ncbi:hypothetical protein pmac_cds_225 [Pandoravirus macleodensis]|uniref:Cyclic nucleotide-binding domain-containing protein n=1 Tax=Pandoravirus macleodensis TaxID=2107707 RepID=A0A2U7UEP2_9VIRU|nr:hypothetical protein pmac_cds_225 [Pandoravirus macleodensis]AVK76913.1 hypothetical protein pmac_cds_225 [Pandoravirus macleodensis]UMO79532.1 hypothetical protein [Pandoravirus aubagnensis]